LYIVNEVCGIDATNQYWYASQGGQKLEELNPDEPDSRKFISQSLVEGVNSSDDINRKPLVSYWYVATIKKVLTNSAIFLAPALLVFLVAIQSGVPVSEALNAVYLWGLNTLVDLTRKFIAGNK